MKTLGIVYAISRSAGDLCKQTVRSLADSAGMTDLVIKTHEQPAFEYKVADDQGIVSLIVASISYLVEKEQAEVIIISANSVHRLFSKIKKTVQEKYPNVKLISMIDATVALVLEKKMTCLSIFGSNSTIASELYQTPLRENHIKFVLPDQEDQAFVNELIKKGVDQHTPDKDRERLRMIANTMKSKGAQAVILACAELPVIFNSNNLGITAIDTNRALATAAIRALS